MCDDFSELSDDGLWPLLREENKKWVELASTAAAMGCNQNRFMNSDVIFKNQKVT